MNIYESLVKFKKATGYDGPDENFLTMIGIEAENDRLKGGQGDYIETALNLMIAWHQQAFFDEIDAFADALVDFRVACLWCKCIALNLEAAEGAKP